MGVFKGQRKGVKVLYSPRASYHLHTTKGESMEELYPQECFWGGLLPSMGIPMAYCDHIPENEFVAVSGQALRNFSKEEVTALFEKNFVILTGDAAETLLDLGLGHLAGIESAKWVKQDNGTFAFEQVTNGKTYRGRKNARASAIVVCSDVLDVTYAADAEVNEYSAMYDSFRRRTLPCQCVVNKKVLIYPYGHFGAPGHIPVMLLNALRQEILQDVLLDANAPFPMVQGNAYLQPHYLSCADGEYLYLVNGSSDAVETVRIAGVTLPETLAVRHSADADLREVHCENNQMNLPIPNMETVLLKLK